MASASITTPPPGERSGDESSGIIGEDRPIVVRYTDSDGNLTDPEDTDTSGTPNASITITAPDDTEVISAVGMTNNETGVFEYIFSTSADAAGTGSYGISVEATFSGEVDVERDTFRLVE